LPCSVSACGSGKSAYPLLDYAPEETNRYRSETKKGCFDVQGCFGAQTELESNEPRSTPIAVDWAERPLGDQPSTSRCIAKLESGRTTESSKLNLALVLPRGTQGHCSGSSCLVVLEADSALGWKVDDSDAASLLLPDAICRMLDSGQLLAVRASTRCAAKTEDIPPCNPDTTVEASDEDAATEVAEPEPVPARHYRFDERGDSAAVFVEDFNNLDLSPVTVDGQPRASTDVDGILGSARSFDSQDYARANSSLEPKESYGVSLWLSLSEAALSTTAKDQQLPVISYLSSTCQSGFRIALERCADGLGVQIAFAHPVGALPGQVTPDQTCTGSCDHLCSVEWHYALLASTSYGGGFYTPWKRGDYRHLALSYSRNAGPTFYVDGRRATLLESSCATPTSLIATPDDAYLYVGSNADAARALVPRTGPLLFDELSLFNQELSEDQVRWLYTNQLTKKGPGGVRWGTWVTQGGRAEIHSSDASLVSATIDDIAYSSAGLFALLQRDPGNGALILDDLADLREYDEAVLWAKLPPNVPFQFALSAEHGLRQCTWQLQSGNEPYYVINLRQPSWCVDPECGFDLSEVERVSIASDWKNSGGRLSSFEVSALSFRKRLFTGEDLSPGTPNRLGGLPGPGEFCWRALSFFPEWLGRLTRYTASRGIGIEVLRRNDTGSNYTELGADLPTSGHSDRPRDFTTCPVVNVCTTEALPAQSLEFVLTNERGQTCSWPLSRVSQSSCYRAPLNASGVLWPRPTEGTADFPPPQVPEDVARTAVRMALRFPGDLQVQSVQCCDADAQNCSEISESVPRGSR
jgi:hypothetical protein